MIQEAVNIQRKWTICRYNNRDEYEQGIIPESIVDGKGNVLPGKSEFKGNVLLNEGINNVLTQVLAGLSSPTVYDEANASLGVGTDGTTSESASQSGLQGGTTTHKGMSSGYPSASSQTITWQSEFGGTEGSHDWKEFTVVNGADDTGDNLNRKVSDQGSKADGQTWTLTLEITFS